MQIRQRHAGEIIVLELSPSHSGDFASELFRPQIESILAEGVTRILFDLSRMSWINSTQLGLLIFAHRLMDEKKGKMALVGMNDRVRSAFEITRLDQFFAIHTSIEEALAG